MGTGNAQQQTHRVLTDHLVRPDETLMIEVLDEPGQGGACHRYDIRGYNATKNPAYAGMDLSYLANATRIAVVFQNGPIKEFGVNGITQEALLAIVIDRLRSFQAGPFACRENAIALTNCEEALMWLQKRTRDRLARGVEGYNQK